MVYREHGDSVIARIVHFAGGACSFAPTDHRSKYSMHHSKPCIVSIHAVDIKPDHRRICKYSSIIPDQSFQVFQHHTRHVFQEFMHRKV